MFYSFIVSPQNLLASFEININTHIYHALLVHSFIKQKVDETLKFQSTELIICLADFNNSFDLPQLAPRRFGAELCCAANPLAKCDVAEHVLVM